MSCCPGKGQAGTEQQRQGSSGPWSQPGHTTTGLGWAGLGWAGLGLTLLCGAKLFCSYSAKHCAALCAVDETMTGMQKKLVTNSVYKRNLFQRLITVTAAYYYLCTMSLGR